MEAGGKPRRTVPGGATDVGGAQFPRAVQTLLQSGLDLRDRRDQEQNSSRGWRWRGDIGWAAEYVYKVKDQGTLEADKLADFIVPDKDYFTIPVDEIKKIRPSITVIGGEIRCVDGKVAGQYGLQPVGVQMPPEFPMGRVLSL